MDNMYTALSPESFTDAAAASQYWDDLAGATVNSGYAGAFIMANEDPSYAETEEYKSILEDCNNRVNAIRTEYAKQYPDIDFDQEFVNAVEAVNNSGMSNEDAFSKMTQAGVFKIDGESLAPMSVTGESIMSGAFSKASQEASSMSVDTETDAETSNEKSSVKSCDIDTGVDYSGNESIDEYDGIS